MGVAVSTGMKPILALLATFAPALAFAQPCAFDPANPGLEALCTDVNGAAEAVPDPCGGKPMTLADALAAAGNTPERAVLVKSVLGVLARETGREMSPAEVEAAIANPATLEAMLTVSLPEVAEGLKKAQAAAK